MPIQWYAACVARYQPDYPDQVPRRQAYERAHPEVTITYMGPYWKAVIAGEHDQTTISRHDLRVLLDALEAEGQTAQEPELPGPLP